MTCVFRRRLFAVIFGYFLMFSCFLLCSSRKERRPLRFSFSTLWCCGSYAVTAATTGSSLCILSPSILLTHSVELFMCLEESTMEETQVRTCYTLLPLVLSHCFRIHTHSTEPPLPSLLLLLHVFCVKTETTYYIATYLMEITKYVTTFLYGRFFQIALNNSFPVLESL